MCGEGSASEPRAPDAAAKKPPKPERFLREIQRGEDRRPLTQKENRRERVGLLREKWEKRERMGRGEEAKQARRIKVMCLLLRRPGDERGGESIEL